MNRKFFFLCLLSCGLSIIHGQSISEIQGNGQVSSFKGKKVITEGIVIGDFQKADELKGFFMQDAAGDNNTATSDGIFVYANAYEFDVKVGDHVKVEGEVGEYYDQTQIQRVEKVKVVSSDKAVQPTKLQFPVRAVEILEQYEGMLVTIDQPLFVSDNFNLGRFGELLLSAEQPLIAPTHIIDPNDDPAEGTNSQGMANLVNVNRQRSLNDRSSILLDDGSTKQNPVPTPYLSSTNNTLRRGSSVTSLTGVISYAFGKYRIQPVGPVVFDYVNRPEPPEMETMDLKVAGFNVLNYFNGDGKGGSFPTERGADTPEEFSRQRDKIISALVTIDADIVGLSEIENDGDGVNSAIADLTNGLNERMGSEVYVFNPDPKGENGNPGSDAIKVALVYKPEKVTPLGVPYADNADVHSRAPLAQAFKVNETGDKLLVIANHFKSKGCKEATGLNEDQHDGQGCYNYKRKRQSAALIAFAGRLSANLNIEHILMIGDHNAHDEEDPLDMLKAYGFQLLTNGDYSYVFNGKAGSLDHAFASPSLAKHVKETVVWHINADEPRMMDYNMEYNPPYLYDRGPYRSSDHDPLIIGFDF